MAAIRVGGKNLHGVSLRCHDALDPDISSRLAGFPMDSNKARIEVHLSCSCIISHVGT
ncbi:MAG: hypothetical protein MUC66_08385 [Methanolinea sp.]|jgi:hypothetical protein|nr:hypothetical protein [Methanolinea sp.]